MPLLPAPYNESSFAAVVIRAGVSKPGCGGADFPVYDGFCSKTTGVYGQAGERTSW